MHEKCPHRKCFYCFLRSIDIHARNFNFYSSQVHLNIHENIFYLIPLFLFFSSSSLSSFIHSFITLILSSDSLTPRHQLKLTIFFMRGALQKSCRHDNGDDRRLSRLLGNAGQEKKKQNIPGARKKTRSHSSTPTRVLIGTPLLFVRVAPICACVMRHQALGLFFLSCPFATCFMKEAA